MAFPTFRTYLLRSKVSCSEHRESNTSQYKILFDPNFSWVILLFFNNLMSPTSVQKAFILLEKIKSYVKMGTSLSYILYRMPSHLSSWENATFFILEIGGRTEKVSAYIEIAIFNYFVDQKSSTRPQLSHLPEKIPC